MNPILKKWFYTKLDDMLNTIFIFNQYLVIPRPEFTKVNNVINLLQVKYVVEEIYGCKIQCEKCVVNVPVDFNNYVVNFYKKTRVEIDDNSIEYLFKWINSLLVLLTDDKSIDDIKNEIHKNTKRNKLLKIIDERKTEIQKLKNNINTIKIKNNVAPDYTKRDEMVYAFNLEYLSFGSLPNITPNEMIIIAKYRSNEPLTDMNLSAISNDVLQVIQAQYPKDELSLDENEFKLIANYRLDLPLIENVENIQLEENLYDTDSDDSSDSEVEHDDIKDVNFHEASGKNIIKYKNTNYVVEGSVVVGKLNKIHSVNYSISNSNNIRGYDKYSVEPLSKKDLKFLKRKGWNLNTDIDIDKKVFKTSKSENINDLREITSEIVKTREEARGKIPKITKLQKKLNDLQDKYEQEIYELKNINDSEEDAVSEYNKFLQSRINMFNNYKLPVKNYNLNTDNENYFISSVVHIIDKLCKWLDIKIITINETKTAVRILLPKNITLTNINTNINDNILQTLINVLSEYDYKLQNNNVLNVLNNIIQQFNNVDVNKRLQVFSNEGKFVKQANPLPSFLIENLQKSTYSDDEDKKSVDTLSKLSSFLVSDKSKKLLEAPKQLNNVNKIHDTNVQHLSKTARFHGFYNDYKANKILPDKPFNKPYKMPEQPIDEAKLKLLQEMKQKELLFKKDSETNKPIQRMTKAEYLDMMKKKY